MCVFVFCLNLWKVHNVSRHKKYSLYSLSNLPSICIQWWVTLCPHRPNDSILPSWHGNASLQDIAREMFGQCTGNASLQGQFKTMTGNTKQITSNVQKYTEIYFNICTGSDNGNELHLGLPMDLSATWMSQMLSFLLYDLWKVLYSLFSSHSTKTT